jgi:hypothetical protein
MIETGKIHFLYTTFLHFVKIERTTLKFCHKDGEKIPGGERGDLKKTAGVILKKKGVVGRFSQGAARMRREGVGVAWGMEGKVIPAAFRRRKPPVFIRAPSGTF